MELQKGIKTKNLQHLRVEVFKRLRQRHTFPGFTQVSSAQAGLTSLFGMGRGGHRRYSHHKYG